MLFVSIVKQIALLLLTVMIVAVVTALLTALVTSFVTTMLIFKKIRAGQALVTR